MWRGQVGQTTSGHDPYIPYIEATLDQVQQWKFAANKRIQSRWWWIDHGHCQSALFGIRRPVVQVRVTVWCHSLRSSSGRGVGLSSFDVPHQLGRVGIKWSSEGHLVILIFFHDQFGSHLFSSFSPFYPLVILGVWYFLVSDICTCLVFLVSWCLQGAIRPHLFPFSFFLVLARGQLARTFCLYVQWSLVTVYHLFHQVKIRTLYVYKYLAVFIFEDLYQVVIISLISDCIQRVVTQINIMYSNCTGTLQISCTRVHVESIQCKFCSEQLFMDEVFFRWFKNACMFTRVI